MSKDLAEELFDPERRDSQPAGNSTNIADQLFREARDRATRKTRSRDAGYLADITGFESASNFGYPKELGERLNEHYKSLSWLMFPEGVEGEQVYLGEITDIVYNFLHNFAEGLLTIEDVEIAKGRLTTEINKFKADGKRTSPLMGESLVQMPEELYKIAMLISEKDVEWFGNLAHKQLVVQKILHEIDQISS